ncbi:zinc finger SWIM domain-containing dorado [Lycorma delicatula]|uniref:zinc finger SWIM domain-containing dorado n=1 Tax=Lycorma delicatula TaxID=130591 RepID=UPI003F5195A7
MFVVVGHKPLDSLRPKVTLSLWVKVALRKWSVSEIFYIQKLAGNLAGSPVVADPGQSLDWTEDVDKFSFEDSDRFEEDSLCSWSSEPESVCNNWRGWKKPSLGPAPVFGVQKKSSDENGTTVTALCELAARCVASHIPFELVEHVYPPVPEQLQLRIAFWSFPDNEEDIRLYSCLANSSADEFQRGEHLFKNRAVKDPLQIGFHLSASVLIPPAFTQRGQYKVAVTFDRRRITSCNCTCNSSAYWCSHIVAVCLHRIHLPNQVCLRAPVSESLSRLHREQLQKFAQYLISELPQQILPTAQRLLDELLSSQPSAINSVCGAPDPTAGASANEQTSWYLDEKTLHNNIKNILIKFCVPAPIVFSDVNYLTTTAPPAAAEWSSLLRPLRGREPEGMWNLLSIVREMFKRNDRNALPLLEIITEECMACDQILVWWFYTKVALHSGSSVGGGGGGKHGNVNSNTHASQHACSSLCDEIVVLWRLAALNPGISPEERKMLQQQFKDWHLKIVDKIKSRGVTGPSTTTTTTTVSGNHHGGSSSSAGTSSKVTSCTGLEVFGGFRPAIEACCMDWDDYQIPGITYNTGASWLYYTQPFTCFKSGGETNREQHTTNPVNSSQAVLNFELPRHGPFGSHHHYHHHNPHLHHSSNASSKRHHNGIPNFLLPERHNGRSVFTHYVYPDVSIRLGSEADLSLHLHNSTSSSHRQRDHNGNRSSVSSEGFCENEENPAQEESDSQEGGGSDSSSSSCSRGRTMQRLERSAISSSDIPLENHHKNDNMKVPLCPVLAGSDVEQRNFQFAPPTQTATQFNVVCVSANAPLHRKDTSSKQQQQQQQQQDNNIVPWLNQTTSDESDSPPGMSSQPQQDGHRPIRRLSKDDSLSSSNSDSQQSGDEYNVYYFDPKTLNSSGNCEKCESSSERTQKQENWADAETAFVNIRGPTDPWEILFARAEGLHAHGHSKEACTLGVKLAEQLLANPPDLMIDVPPMMSKGKRKKQQINPASHQLSVLASDTLAKCAFLCTVLAENPEYYHLAFKVGLFGLEMARPPASTKPLEVKLANQESELVNLLKRIPLGEWELNIIRERAHQLRDGTLRSRGEALLPINLAGFLLDALIMPSAGRECRCQVLSPSLRQANDEILGFEAAVAALGLKANISEADHPLLCEGTRRQRGDLAITLLVLYKDDPVKVARIMDKLLDRDVHQLIKSPVPISYYSSNPPLRSLGCRPLPTRKDLDTPLLCPASPPQTAFMAPMAIPDACGASALNSNGVTNGCGSRPQSCTSAELDQGLPGLPPAQTTAAPTTTSTATTSVRSKESLRFKGKRAYPSIPNQPSEAGAHFTFELAKTILTKAGGNSSTSLFTQVNTNQNHHGPHRALHMCAFQLGLYALGLHNCVSPNWLSRTYSSHVSWITGQAMEIGAPAITFLMDTWEGHLTPPEAASIADRASRGCDANMVFAAAELALSCLPHAHALNPNEIQRAILQCKEQSEMMLEHSCLTVEGAAKGGGVYPEVLFQVAKYWYELFVRHTPGGDQMLESEPSEEGNSSGLVSLVEQSLPPPPTPPSQPPPSAPMHQPMPPYHPPPIGLPYTVAPYGFAVQAIHPPHSQIATRHLIPPNQIYHLPPPTFQYPPHASNQQPPIIQYYGMRPANGMPHHVFPIATATMQPATTIQVAPNQGQIAVITHSPTQPVPQPPVPVTVAASPHVTRSPQQPPQQVHRQQPSTSQFSQTQLRYLLAAYRVGMLALETLARRVHDDRPLAKYARNPPYGEDVKWLLRIAKKLGTQYLHQFCVCAVNSIVSPFVLHDVALEAAHYLSRNNPSLVMQHLRSALTPLVQKCQQMYIQCMHQKLYHLTTGDYEDFVSIVCAARAAFQITPEGNTQFKEWLQSIRRSKSCKKDLWSQINTALQANSK